MFKGRQQAHDVISHELHEQNCCKPVNSIRGGEEKKGLCWGFVFGSRGTWMHDVFLKDARGHSRAFGMVISFDAFF